MRNNLLSQAKFAKGAGIDPGHFCEMLKHDMTRAEQQELIDKYKEEK